MRISVLEYGRLERRALRPRLWRALRTHDEAQARRTRRSPVFDWRFRDFARAGNTVGVLCVGDLTVEVLPKVSAADTGDSRALARGNLLHMLHVARQITVRVDGHAHVETAHMPLLDALALVFASSLLRELTRGPHRSYEVREENLGHVKGRVVLPEHLRRNAILQHRVFVRHDEFDVDTTINRTLRAATTLLFRGCSAASAKSAMTRILDELSDVADTVPSERELRDVTFHRNNRRFEPHVAFARMILAGRSPTPRAGADQGFSILFDMHRLFEAYVARYFVLNARKLGLDPTFIRPQARGRRTYLLRHTVSDRPVFRLKPDLVIEPHGDFPGLVLDTKWKLLASDNSRSRRAAGSDLYQMASYAHRFDMPDNVLLYPSVSGAAEASYVVEDTNTRLHVRTLSLDHDLRKDRHRTLAAFRSIVGQVACASSTGNPELA